jgi:hypothetical protein
MTLIRNILFVFIICALPAQAIAQDTLSLHSADSTRVTLSITSPAYYVAPTLTWGSFGGRTTTHAGVAAGVVFSRRYEVSIYYHQMLDNFFKRVIFPELYHLNTEEAGIRLNYLLALHKRVFASFGGRAGLGWNYWRASDDDDNAFSDQTYTVAPEVGVGYIICRWAMLRAHAGYNKTLDVELAGIETTDFDGVNFGLSLNLGKIHYE